MSVIFRPLTLEDFLVQKELTFLKELGFSYASFGFKSLKTGEVFGCFSDPKWARFYISNDLFEHDPLAQTACVMANHKILWSAVSIDSSKGYEVMQERASVSGARFGVTLAINDGKVQEIIAIGDSAEENTFLKRFMRYFPQIQEVRRSIKHRYLGGL
jgi:Autoinducer binding domain